MTMAEQQDGISSIDNLDVRLSEGVIDIHHHTELPTTRLSSALDAVVGRTGKLFSWLWVAVIGVILVSVVSRYMFGQGSILLEEISWHLYGAAWTMGLAYTLVTDDHVRVDVLHERFSLRTQAWIEVLGYSVPYAWESYLQQETSQAPSGLPYRFILKSFIALSLALIVVAAVARLLKCTALLFGWPRPVKIVK
jgi:TRAP-type mannitol/chloroaromatic compound transport system permease small subunit